MAKVWITAVAIGHISMLAAPVVATQTPRGFVPCVPTETCGPVVRVDSDDRVKQLEQLATTKTDPESWYFVAKYCSERSADSDLSAFDARRYVLRGIQAIDRALAINPIYLEALRMRSTLLTQQAKYEKDQDVRNRVVAEAKLYQDSADQIAKRQPAVRAQ